MFREEADSLRDEAASLDRRADELDEEAEKIESNAPAVSEYQEAITTLFALPALAEFERLEIERLQEAGKLSARDVLQKFFSVGEPPPAAVFDAIAIENEQGARRAIGR